MLYSACVALKEVLDPQATLVFSWPAMRAVVKETIPWYGATFAATYLALYARFASQWTYLAGLYNQIKAEEVKAAASGAAGAVAAAEVLASWKAGFVEDADELHPAPKRMFAGIIQDWLQDANVRLEFVGFTPNGATRLERITADVNRNFQPPSQQVDIGDGGDQSVAA
jgi:hypothetical protein